MSQSYFFDGGFGFGLTVGVDAVAGWDIDDRSNYGTTRPVNNVGAALSGDIGGALFVSDFGSGASAAGFLNYGAFARFGNHETSTPSISPGHNEAHGAFAGWGVNAFLTTANDVDALAESLANTGSVRAGVGSFGGSLVWGVTEGGDISVIINVSPIPGQGFGLSWGVSPTSTVVLGGFP